MDNLSPDTLDKVSVQLIFGDGEPPYQNEGLWIQIYAAALPPFVLGIPANQVRLYLSHQYLGKDEQFWNVKAGAAGYMENLADGERLVPADYLAYFLQVYNDAAVGHEVLPACSLRFFSGHGMGTGDVRSTHVKCGNAAQPALRFPHVGGTTSVLTVLDTCASPHTAACMMSGLLPVEQGDREQDARNLIAFQRTYKSKKIFQQLDFPLACSKSGNAFCCRVGWNGQQLAGQGHPLYKSPENGGIISALLCFPAVSSLLTSIKDRYTDKNDDRGLDLIFQEKFRKVQMRYVADGKMMAQAHSDLSRLQKLIDDDIAY